MIHVIIVDDELLAGVGIQSLIDGKEGIQVDGVFAGPEEAIPFLRENQIDIVITDIEMAQMNGLDFIQAIRESGLADGVIILSCHDDFSYAQEAISKGTDSYLLKHKISGPVLIEEVKKVYLKTHKENRESDADFGGKGFSWDSMKEEVYTVCVLLFYSADGSDDVKEDQVRGKMMYHLIEQIVSRYQLGTVIQPYDRSPFLLFRQDPDKPEKERKTEIISGLSILLKHIRQYYSRKVTAGLSNEFTELSSMREQYEKAASAAEKYFYEPEKEFFFYHAPIREFQNPEFSSEGFLEENGISVFAEELKYCLKQASFCAVSLENIRARLVQSVSRMLFRVLDRNPYLQNFQGKKELDARILSAIIHAGDAKELQERLIDVLSKYHKDFRESLGQDPLSAVFSYIDEHLADRLSLDELAEIGCMSIPTFTKKFKDRTGMTLVQYLNEKRIMRAKVLLMNKNLSLEQIAEETGFSNANYLVRVFKKVTGSTISDYRR